MFERFYAWGDAFIEQKARFHFSKGESFYSGRVKGKGIVQELVAMDDIRQVKSLVLLYKIDCTSLLFHVIKYLIMIIISTLY